MHPHFRVRSTPKAHAESVIRGDQWRISVLTDGLVRLEWSPDGEFEDRASMLALHRDLPTPEYRVVEIDHSIEVITDRFHLTYDRGRFTTAGLSLQVRGNVSNYDSVWRFGEPVDDLRGTARTLDNIDGRLPLEPGVVSRGGVAVLDDSSSIVLEDNGWVSPRTGDRIDLYVFAYGHDYEEGLRAFYALSGDQPIVPRWALGNWWSRYYDYSAPEYLQLLDRFDAEGVPFSVAVIDMDWHPVAGVDPRYGSGWTGYSWNRELFPEPKAFLDELHRRGLRVTLNVHPADGVRAFEDAYPEMAEALGRETDEGLGIAFDVTDEAFLDAYFSVLHRRLEDDGVDFWWVDWQSGPHSRVPGIDPLWMLNHYHFLDASLDDRRPLLLSRYAGPGSHRYPVGFSGDTVISWASLDFQPEFTATAANIGYGWWSHDIGGHFFGSRDDELMVRWVQLGLFSPILRLHSSNNPFLVKEPWEFGPEARHAIVEALRYRHRLVPYLHSMNHHGASHGTPLVRPMYHLAPDAASAYRVPNQFAFGTELVVAPITTPRDPMSLLGAAHVWLPDGVWIDLFTGVAYDGGRELVLHRDGDTVPALLRAGGILPLAASDQSDATVNPRALEIVVAPGADGAFTLIEDDGTGTSPDSIPTARTTITWDQGAGTLHIAPVAGASGIVPDRRTWTVTLLGASADRHPTDAGTPNSATDPWSLTIADHPTNEPLHFTFTPDPAPVTSDLVGRVFSLLNRAQCPYELKKDAWEVLTGAGSPAAKIAALHALGVPDPILQPIVELLTARG